MEELQGFPPYITEAHNEDDIQYMLKAFTESVETMVDAGIFGDQKEPSLLTDPGRFPLTIGQQEIWYSSQMGEAAACSYNESDTLHLKGPLDVDKLRMAISGVLKRHQSIHLRFSPEGDFQYVARDRNIDVPFIDLADLSEDECQKRLDDLLAQEATTPFDLENGPLVRANLIRRRRNDHLLVFYGNHLVFDGWSSGVIFDEIGTVYSSTDPAGALQMLPEPTPFSDYAALEAAAEVSGERGKARAHWLAQFEDLPPVLDLPGDRLRPVARSFSGSTVKWKLRDSVYLAIKKAAARHNTSLFAILLAA